jgi:hypothetical protein
LPTVLVPRIVICPVATTFVAKTFVVVRAFEAVMLAVAYKSLTGTFGGMTIFATML